MDYNGGPVMPSNTDYLVFWSPQGFGAYGPGSPPEYVTGLEQYFKDLPHDNGGHQNADSVSTQYNDSTGAFAQIRGDVRRRAARHASVPREPVSGATAR